MCIYYFNPRRDHTIIYSDYVKAVLLAAIDRLAADPETYANKLGKDFTSNRKLGFKRLTLMYLTMEGECIREEIYKFFERITGAPSKAAFYKQLQKLKDGALRYLLLAFNRKLKDSLYDGKYRFIACNGSALDVHVWCILSRLQSERKREYPGLGESYRPYAGRFPWTTLRTRCMSMASPCGSSVTRPPPASS